MSSGQPDKGPTPSEERLSFPEGTVFRYVSYPTRSWAQDEAMLRAHAELADQLRPNESTPWVLALAFYDATGGTSLSYEVFNQAGEPTGETHTTNLIAVLAFQDVDTMKQYLALKEEKQPLVDDALQVLGLDPGFRASREFEIPAGFRLVHDRTIGNPDVHYQFPTPPAQEAAPQG